jgi:uncharacterized protein
MIRHISALAALVALSLSSVACVGADGQEDTTKAEETSQDLVSRSASFSTFQGADGRHYFNLASTNGEIVLSSQGYTTRAAAEAGLASVIENGNDKRNFDMLESRDGQWYFTLSAANGEVIGTSELYPSKSNAERGAATVRALVRIEQQKSAQ